MRLEVEAANILAEAMADLLAGGNVDVFDGAGVLLAVCPFAAPPFNSARDGAVAAHPFPPARGLADGAPARFVAYDADGMAVLEGSAGHKDDPLKPEMAFKARVIVEDADVMIESFVFSIIRRAPSNDVRPKP